MPSAHAKLGPSSSSRWLTCTASIGMAEKVPAQPESPYAAEGTMAHTLGELKASVEFGLITRKQFDAAMDDFNNSFHAMYGADDHERLHDMHRHTDAYVELIRERMERVPGSVLLLEQRVDTGVPKCWGTSDVVIVSFEHVEIIDLKYGQGVPVDAFENTQLMLYGVGALDTFGDILGHPKMVYMTVFQPRLDAQSTYELAPIELRAWRDEVARPAAEEALGSNPKFAPSDTACRWCPAAGWCKPRAEKSLAEDFDTDPDLLSPEDLADILPRLSEIKAWCAAVADTALDRVYSQGEDVPGYKVVRSGGKRYVKDEDVTTAIQTLIDAGYPAEKVAAFKMKTLGELEKLVGKKNLPVLLDGLLIKGTGSPSLVPVSDSREAISPATEAAKDFS